MLLCEGADRNKRPLMLFEIVGFLVVLGLGYLVWRLIERRRWSSSGPEHGERWKLIEVQPHTSGAVHLIQSVDDGKWGLQKISTNDGVWSDTLWYPTERQAREAFSKSNENIAT